MMRDQSTSIRKTPKRRCRLCGKSATFPNFYRHYTTRTYHSYCRACTLALAACKTALDGEQGLPELLRAKYSTVLRIGHVVGIRPSHLGRLIAKDIKWTRRQQEVKMRQGLLNELL